jgi:dipeptidyl aminopeptidase/acylaminoacyl peptidase
MQSYGGYMAGMAGSSETGVYSAAISQAPVTDWHYYGMSTTITEQCMTVLEMWEEIYA